MKHVGYSLSGCLQSIARGEVALADVAYIVTNTAYLDRAHMVESLAPEMKGTQGARMLQDAVTLWNSGRIFQPSVRPASRRIETLWRDATPAEACMDSADAATPAHPDVVDEGGDILMAGGFGGPGIGKSAVVSRPVGDAKNAGAEALTLPLPFDVIELNRGQTQALGAILSGKSAIIAGVPGSGRSLVAAVAARQWDAVAERHGVKRALVVTLTGGDRLRLQGLGECVACTYGDMERLIEGGIESLADEYGLIILDDYAPEVATRLDGHLANLPHLPVTRIVREEEKLSLRADVGLLARIRQK